MVPSSGIIKTFFHQLFFTQSLAKIQFVTFSASQKFVRCTVCLIGRIRYLYCIWQYTLLCNYLFFKHYNIYLHINFCNTDNPIFYYYYLIWPLWTCRELDALTGTGQGQGQEKTKAAIRERLRNMNLQFSAIDEMSHQIEQDFRSARSVSRLTWQLCGR